MEKINQFLDQKVIAVAGVSSNPEKGEAANAIFEKFKNSGYTVYAVNPKKGKIGDDPFYPDLKSLPEKADAVVAVTNPDATDKIVQQCIKDKINHVWMHRSFGPGSISQKAVEMCEQNNINFIAGACPMMFLQPVDFGHKCIRWILKVGGKLPA